MPSIDDVRRHLASASFKSSLESHVTAGLGALAAQLESRSFDDFEHDQAIAELYLLSRGQDCHYDRPSIGAHYALWYHPRRIQTAVLALLEPLLSRDGDLTVVDLGGGTGAAWWAVAAIEQARVTLGGKPRTVTIEAIDSSAPMVAAAELMWSVCSDRWEATRLVKVRSRVGGWATPDDVPPDPIVLAAYLLDHSDRHRSQQIASLLHDRLEQMQATRCVVVMASNKPWFTTGLDDALCGGDEWECASERLSAPMWSGPVAGLGEIRHQLAQGIQGRAHSRLLRSPTWEEPRVGTGVINLVRQPYATFIGHLGHQVLLSSEQSEAAKPGARMTEILGAAGTGKSRVLIERVLNEFVSAVRSRRSVSMLVTTFNIDLTDQLVEWFKQAHEASSELAPFPLSCEREERGDKRFSFTVQGVVNCSIRFMNWDKVPTRLFGVKAGSPSSESVDVLAKLVKSWTDRDPRGSRAAWLGSTPWMDEGFLIEELRRVVFGLGVSSEAEYLQVQRVGRGTSVRLPTDSVGRKMLWSLMMGDRKERLYVDLRIEMIRAIESGRAASTRYDFLFVDEGQDFLGVEYSRAFPALVHDPNQIVVAADPTQALHTGASYSPPRTIHSSDGSIARRWTSHRLSGSYRLPLWVADCVRPLASQVLENQSNLRSSTDTDVEVNPEDIVMPTAVKNAVLGVRPVVIAADTFAEAGRAILDIVDTHRRLLPVDEPIQMTWAEADRKAGGDFAKTMASLGCSSRLVAQPASMLKIKGLERPLVLWRSTDIAETVPGVSVPENIYTALTRTTSLLIIALGRETRMDVRELVTRLDRRHLCFWNESAEKRFDDWVEELNH